MEKTKKNRIKKVILAALAVATVAAITVSMTMAYLTDSTEKKTNRFLGSGGVTAVLYEPDWDGSSVDNPEGLGDDQLDSIPNTNEPYGKKEAQKYKINDPILKNPKIANTSSVDEYVAIKLTYLIDLDGDGETEEVTKEEFEKLVTINGWSDKWIQYGNTNIYVYNESLLCMEKSEDGDDMVVTSTEDLFKSITVNKELIPGEPFKLSDSKTINLSQKEPEYSMPLFDIKVEGVVIDCADKTKGPSDSDKETLASLLGETTNTEVDENAEGSGE